MVKNLPVAFSGLIPGLARAHGEVNDNLFHILACKIPWTEKNGGLQSMGCKE